MQRMKLLKWEIRHNGDYEEKLVTIRLESNEDIEQLEKNPNLTEYFQSKPLRLLFASQRNDQE